MSDHDSTDRAISIRERANELLAAGKISEAESELSRYLHNAPRDADAQHQHGCLNLDLDRLDAALESFHRAVGMDPANSVFLNDLGTAYQAAGRTDEAGEAYLAATRGEPPSAAAHYNYALILSATGHLEEALRHFKRAAEIAPDSRVVRRELGILLHRLGKLEEALDTFDVLLREDPADIGALCAAGGVDTRRCQFERAEARYRACLDIDPHYDEAILGLGYCLQELGRFDEALSVYRRLVENDPARYYDVVKRIISASRGRFWVDASALKRALLGKPPI